MSENKENDLNKTKLKLAYKKAGIDCSPLPIKARHYWLFQTGLHLRDKQGFTKQKSLEFMILVNNLRCEPPLDIHEIEGIASRVENYLNPSPCNTQI